MIDAIESGPGISATQAMFMELIRSGASKNPARSFGPDVALLDFTNY